MSLKLKYLKKIYLTLNQMKEPANKQQTNNNHKSIATFFEQTSTSSVNGTFDRLETDRFTREININAP